MLQSIFSICSFPWAWSLLKSIQAPFLLLGVIINALIDRNFGSKTSIYVCIVLVLISSGVMFLIDVCKRKRGRSRRRKEESKVFIKKDTGHVVVEAEEEEEEEEEGEPLNERRNSLPDGDDDFLPPLTLMTQQRSVTYGDLVDGNNPNMTCHSEVEDELESLSLLKYFLHLGGTGWVKHFGQNPGGAGISGEPDLLQQGGHL